jgi:hypothetical protein
MKHFEKETKFESGRHIDNDPKGPWKGMSPKDDYGRFEILFRTNGNFEFVMVHEHKEDNIDHGERIYEQKSNFSGIYEIETNASDKLIVNLNITHEVKIISKCTNFDFKPKEEISHNLNIKFTSFKNKDFLFSNAKIFLFEGGYYGGFVFTEK